MNTADSLASGALGAVVVALGWLIAHSAQIKKVLELLPTIAADAAKARAVVDSGRVGQAVTHVRTEVTGDIEAIVRKVLATQANTLTAPAASTPASPGPSQPAA